MKKRLPSSEHFCSNLETLLNTTGMKVAELSKKSGLSYRAIKFYLNKEQSPTVDTADKIGKVFNLEGWEMIMPNIESDINIEPTIFKDNYFKKPIEEYLA